jgi:hypothetical protein
MKKEDGFQIQNLNQVLHDAHLRRTADLGVWLKQYLERRRRSRLHKELSSPLSIAAPPHRQVI